MGTRINRRRLIAGAAAGTALGSGGIVRAGSTAYSVPKIMRAQNAPVEIDFYHIWGTPVGGAEPDVLHPSVKVINLFNENQSDIKVNTLTPGGYPETFQKAQADMAAGKIPALVITPWAYLTTARGLNIQNLSAIFGDRLDELMGVITDEVKALVTTEDDEVLGLPYAFSTCTWYYNPAHTEAAGVNPEEAFATWEALAEAAPEIQGANDGTSVFGFAVNADFVAQSLVQSNGGWILQDGVPAMDSAEAQAAMQFVAELNDAGYRDPSAPGEVRTNWQAGFTTFMQASPASLGGLRQSTSFEFDTLMFPAFKGKDRLTTSGGSFIGVYAQEQEQQDAAFEFLKFALTEEAYGIWMETGYLNITTYDLPVLEGQEAAYAHLEEGVTSETNWPSDRGVEAAGVWATYCERMWANDISVEEGSTAAVEELSSIIGVS